MQRQAYFHLCFGVVILLVFPSQVHCSNSGDYKVLIWNSGSAQTGEITSFKAKVVLKPEARTRHKLIKANENVTFEFSWKVPSQPWIKHQKTTHRWDSFQWRWTEAGDKTVSVCVRILDVSGRDLAMNRTEVTVKEADDKIIATLHANQSSTPKGNLSFYAGTVTLEVTIHNFQHQNLSNITYDWNLGDGTDLISSNLNTLNHNFTTVENCTVVVTLHGWIHGKFCKGTTRLTLKFKVKIEAYLVIKSSAGPKLPSDYPYALPAKHRVEFEVKFKDPFHLVASVSTDWIFGDHSPFVIEWNKTTLYHTYHEEGNYPLWVTVRANTKFFGKKSSQIIGKTLYVKAPVSLKVRHKHLDHKDKTVRFNISCNGSLPVSFHLCITKQCNLPPGEIRSLTVEHSSSCNLIVNHSFNDPGKYCVNIGVMNDVSSTNTSLMVQIPGDVPGPKHSSSKSSITRIFVAVFIMCILLIVVIVFVTRKWIYRKTANTEKANFEFRDDDALSVSSLELYGTKTCFRRWRIWGLHRKDEKTPLLKELPMYSL